jgi:acetoacetyl-CoA synthetase
MTEPKSAPSLLPAAREGELLWTPSAAQIAYANLTPFQDWLRREGRCDARSYLELWRWSVEHLEDFWRAIWDYFRLESSTPVTRVLGKRSMPGAEWFPGTRLNYTQHILRNERAGEAALFYLSETQPLTAVQWDDIGTQVRKLASALRELGVKPGDRVVAYMPNIPATLVALYATAAIGAVWASCSPDFGSRGVLDRLQQLKPKVLFCVDGYMYGGKPFDRRGELAEIIAALAGLEHVIFLPHLDKASAQRPRADARLWSEVMDRPAIAPQDFRYEILPFDHPLWILFSSGTTGLPKAIVQSHGGTLLEQYKAISFHHDMHPGERMFFFTTTGWMMWNFLVSSLLVRAVPVLYEGNPAYPDADVLWRMAQDCGASYFGASPTYVDIMAKAGIVPGKKFDLSKLRAITPAGSPVTPGHTKWFYTNVKPDLWIATGSGGTDVCTGLVGGVPTLPVEAGVIQAPALGVAIAAFDEHGHSVVDQVGEMVITEPMPSMPVYFWNDPDGTRYRDSYFEMYPGIWRQGDFFRINARGGCFVLGRSDATLNRHGVRIGTAEIYRALAQLPEIDDSLIVNLDLPGGQFFMPLFVRLRAGHELDAALVKKISAHLRSEYTPRHVPDKVYQVPEIPATLTGKKMEVPVRRILMGMAPEKAANLNAMASPRALDWFIEYARTQQDYSLR